jgi:hypothetical protein
MAIDRFPAAGDLSRKPGLGAPCVLNLTCTVLCGEVLHVLTPAQDGERSSREFIHGCGWIVGHWASYYDFDDPLWFDMTAYLPRPHIPYFWWMQ